MFSRLILNELIRFALVFANLLLTIHSAPPYSIQGGVGSGKQAKGRTANVIRKTNAGIPRQTKKLEKFVDMHKDIKNLNLDPVTKAKRTKKLGEAQKRLDTLNYHQSVRKAIQESNPGLGRAKYASLTKKAIKQGQSSASTSMPSSANQSPQRSNSPDSVMSKHFGGWQVSESHQNSPDSVMTKHFGGWQAPESHQVSAH